MAPVAGISYMSIHPGRDSFIDPHSAEFLLFRMVCRPSGTLRVVRLRGLLIRSERKAGNTELSLGQALYGITVTITAACPFTSAA
jgi:hypothetical protein